MAGLDVSWIEHVGQCVAFGEMELDEPEECSANVGFTKLRIVTHNIAAS